MSNLRRIASTSTLFYTTIGTWTETISAPTILGTSLIIDQSPIPVPSIINATHFSNSPASLTWHELNMAFILLFIGVWFMVPVFRLV